MLELIFMKLMDTGSGFIPFEKDEWDIKLGNLINVQNVKLKNKMGDE